MIDVIRVQLPEQVKRFPMFTVDDQLRFLQTSADMEGKSLTEQQQILDEVLDVLYPSYSKTEQEYIFTKVYCVSFGKAAIRISIKNGSSSSEAFMHITDYELQNEYKVDEQITLGFRFPKTRKVDETMFLECISYIVHNGTRYDWASLSDDTHEKVCDLVDMEDIENIVTMLTKSCEIKIKQDSFSNLLTLFKILFTKNEMIDFFKTNYLLNKHKIDIGTISKVSPMERSVYVSMLAEDLKRQENAKS